MSDSRLITEAYQQCLNYEYLNCTVEVHKTAFNQLIWSVTGKTQVYPSLVGAKASSCYYKRCDFIKSDASEKDVKLFVDTFPSKQEPRRF